MNIISNRPWLYADTLELHFKKFKIIKSINVNLKKILDCKPHSAPEPPIDNLDVNRYDRNDSNGRLRIISCDFWTCLSLLFEQLLNFFKLKV